jgi:mRNA-degrading endonuclease RelE of RelBE toxin-antitoxin system
MRYSVFTIPPFDKQLKRLVKKFPSLRTEFANLLDDIEHSRFQGSPLANSCVKIRIAIRSKGKGKSGGGRVIVHIRIVEETVYLLTIYDKSEQETITKDEINYLLSFII